MLDLANMSVASKYAGEEQVSIGSGQSLLITHTGCGILHTPMFSFQLSNLLCVPNIASNLLYVHQLYVDNNCITVFDSNNFFVQDKSTDKILFQGPSVNGLYPLTSLAAQSLFPSPVCSIAHAGINTSFHLWHNRLGHPSTQVLNSVFHLLNLPLCNSNKCVCEHCLKRKMTKLPFSFFSYCF